MTQETPVKVFSLLGLALTSMFFLLAVSATNASFAGVESPFPDPFSPDKVVMVLDNAANAYSRLVYVNLVEPGQADYALAADNLGFIGQEAGPQIMSYLGLDGQNQPIFEVAGASQQIVVSQYYPPEKLELNMSKLYSFLIQ